MTDSSGRLMAALPGIYRASDKSGHLRALLAAFEQILLDSGDRNAPAIAAQIDAIPDLLAPEGGAPDSYLPWLAQWVAFTPYHHFAPERLRHIVAGIVPLYGSRGTRQYLEKLIALCFDESAALTIDEDPVRGWVLGMARVGVDTWLTTGEPFCFRVEMSVRSTAPEEGSAPWRLFENSVRAVIDFAKPAHTQYELVLRRGPPNAEETTDP